ncbi:protein of unknown function [Nitrospira japonica]|uniref:Uncharacterized protein n=1 Tax=Nitrospira japonica TaxID=1325564 RepID=A0A1W1I1E0_9BACT|nr:protein of unknown function [Nitrospira japonica]
MLPANRAIPRQDECVTLGKTAVRLGGRRDSQEILQCFPSFTPWPTEKLSECQTVCPERLAFAP